MDNGCVFFLIWCLIRYFLHPPFQQEIINTFVLTFPDALFEKLIPIAVPVPMQALKIAVLNCAPEIIYRHSKMFYLIRFFFGKADNRKDLCNPNFCSTRSCNTPHISAAYTAHHNTDIFVYPFDLIVEYSGWFYISCLVIWKSLFRFAFVYIES